MSRPSTVNPVEYTYGAPNTGSTAHSIPYPEPISAVRHHIAGILVTVFGLNELPPGTSDIAVLWLLHPRLQTQACMAPFAAHLISEWNKHRSSVNNSNSKKGLIAVSFDQRNHGSRKVSDMANEAWRTGNEHHAPDMFSCYAGTAVDTSVLLDYLPGYIFPEPSDPRRIVQNLVLGVSLGGHAAWHCVMQDPRISAAIVTIGCPDYARLMSDRARLSKRKSWLDGQGSNFFGSADFPPSLVEAVQKYDPAGLLWSTLKSATGTDRRPYQEHLYDGDQMTAEEKQKLMPLMVRCFGNKRVLNLAGGSDKLVNYSHSKPFLDWLKKAIGRNGWFEGGGLYLEDIVYPGVGHDVPPEMVTAMVKFVNDTLQNEQVVTHAKLGSKI
ncbi:hypothetical protein ABEF93_007091 [Exophiala dermatitidis]